MVDYHYIKRGNKIYGPYYYRSYRVGKKVKKEYLGKNYPKKIRAKKTIKSLFHFIVLLILIASSFYLIPYFAGITSKATAEPSSTTLENNESLQNLAENLTMEIIDSISSSNPQINLSELANMTLNEIATEENESNVSEINTIYPFVEQPGVNLLNATNATEQPTEINATPYPLKQDENITNETRQPVGVKATVLNETLVQHKAVIGKPVRWTKRIMLEKPSNLTTELPKEASNITIKEIVNETSEFVLASPVTITGQVTSEIELTGRKKEQTLLEFLINLFRKITAAITGHAVEEQPRETEKVVEIKENVTEVEVEYYTDAPQATEEQIPQGKRIIIFGPDALHYQDILAYIYLDKEVKDDKAITLYWLNGSEKQKVDFTAYDTNNNSLTDYIEWNVPHLSNQTYELLITEINVQKKPDDLGTELADKRTYNQKVFDAGDGKQRYIIHTAQINYKDEQGNFQEINTTLNFDEKEKIWEQSNASYHSKIPEYADGWFEFYNAYEGANQTIKAKPAASHIKGEYFKETDGSQGVIYKDAFGTGIDLKVYAYWAGLKKVIIINGKPADISKDLTFDFELQLPIGKEKVKDREDNVWDGTFKLDFKDKTLKIGDDDKESYFRNARIWDSGEARGINQPVDIELYKQGNKIYLRKTITKDILEKATYPLYTDHPTSYYAGAGDGFITGGYKSYESDQTIWDNAHDLTTGTAVDYTGSATGYIGEMMISDPPNHVYIYRFFVPIDTNGIAGTITNAILYIYPEATYSPGSLAQEWVNVVQTTQPSTSALTTADFDLCGDINNPTEGATRINTDNVIANQYNGWTLNATGRGWINITGVTKLGLRGGHDITDTLIGVPTKYNLIYNIRTSEYTGTASDPYLDVTAAIPNTAPFIENITITPSPAYTNSTLNCSANYGDADSDKGNVSIIWYNGTNIYGNITILDVIAGQMISNSTPAGIQIKSETWNCTMNATDAADNAGVPNSTTRIISNTLPEVQGISLIPTSPLDNQDLECSFITADADLDKTNASVRWYNNSILALTQSLNNDYANSTTVKSNLTSGNLTASQQWLCEVWLNDSALNSSKVNSSAVTILSSAPFIQNISIAPTTAYTNSTLNCSANYGDPNSDKGNVSIAWYNGSAGTSLFSSYNIFNINSGDAVSFELRTFMNGLAENMSDGFTTGTGIGGYNAYGITTNGSDFWIIDAGDDFVYHLNRTGGNMSDGFKVGNFGCGSGRGITTNGSDFWITDWVDWYVYHTNRTGSQINDGFSTSAFGAGGVLDGPEGITTNGSDFWIVDDYDDFVYHVNWTSGVGIATNMTDGFKTTAFGSSVFDITTNGSDFWILIDYTNILHVNRTGSSMGDNFTISQFGVTYPRGVTSNIIAGRGSGYWGIPTDFWILDYSDWFVYHAKGAGGIQSKGETWNCTINATDSADNAGAPNSTTRTISSIAPEVQNIQLLPSLNPSILDLECSFQAYDLDGDKTNATVRWYNNSVWALTQNLNNSYASGTTLKSNLTSGNITFGETWNCEAWLYDGTSNSTLINSSNSYISYNLTTCNNITQSGSYTLIQSITDWNGAGSSACINITASDVEIDCVGWSNWIDGVSGDTAIETGNTSIKFTNLTIKNCNLTGWSYGIKFIEAQNSSIDNLTIKSSTYPIYLSSPSSYNNLSNITSKVITVIYINSNFNRLQNISSSNCTISPNPCMYITGENNTFIEITASRSAQNGIALYGASNNTFTNVTAVENANSGILLDSGSNNNLIMNVNASNNSFYGIYLYKNCYYNNLINITAIGSGGSSAGVYFQLSTIGGLPGPTSNQLINSTLKNNGYGVYLRDVQNNNITGTRIENNSRGIWIRTSDGYNTSYNRFWDNIINNTPNGGRNIVTTGINYTNYFNTTKQAGTNIIGGSWIAGNWWSDYSGIDADADEIGDTAYVINGSLMNDSLPLVYRETIPPNVTLLDPPNLNSTTATTVTFTYNVSDNSNIANCSLIINTTLMQTDTTITKNTNQSISQDLYVGVFNWTINCTDAANNQYQPTTRTLNITSAVTAGETPNIVFMPPTPDDGARQVRNWIYVNVSVNTTTNNVSSCLLEWNSGGGPVNETMNKIGSGTNVTCWTNKTTTDGSTYTYKVYANDTTNAFGNSSSRSNVENSMPSAVSLVYPAQGSTTTNRTPQLNWSASSDSEGDSITYQINITCYPSCSGDNRLFNNSASNQNWTNVSSRLLYFWDDLYYYNWTVRAWDGYEFGAWNGTPFAMKLSSLISLSMLNATVNFSDLLIGQTENTTTDNPFPLSIRNDGNSFVSINMSNDTALIWSTQQSPSEYFRYKIDNVTGENGSFNWTGSITTWTNVPVANNTPITFFNYTDASDSAEIDILVTVPPAESPGAKSARLVFTGWYVRET